MNAILVEENQRYSVALEVLVSSDGLLYTRHRATSGTVVQERGGRTFAVVPGDVCSLEITLGPNGLTIRKLKLLTGKQVHLTAVVTPGQEAPEWLPAESTYLIFNGGRPQSSGLAEQFIPLDGMAAERSWPSDESVPLDRLAVAVGRSVARANQTLSKNQCEAGVGLVSSVTIRVAVDQTDLVQGRVLVNLARPGQGGADGGCTGGKCAPNGNCPPQYVELTMTTVPCSPSDPQEVANPTDSLKIRSSTIEQDCGWYRSK